MATVAVGPVAVQQFFDDDGNPLALGLVYSYIAGSSTPQPIYKNVGLSIAYDNPFTLTASGRPPSNGAMYFLTTPAYKIIVTDADGNVITTTDSVIAVAGAS